MFWGFTKSIFQFFGKFLSDEVETIFWEIEPKCSKVFQSKFGYRKLPRKWFWRYLKLKNKGSERLKRAFSSFFASFRVTNWESSSVKVRQSIEKYLNHNLLIGSFLENGFEGTLSSKTKVLSVWKDHFSPFWKFLIFWKSKFGHRKLSRKLFWRYLELKNECSVCLKRAFLIFLLIFDWRSWTDVLGKWDKDLRTL